MAPAATSSSSSSSACGGGGGSSSFAAHGSDDLPLSSFHSRLSSSHSRLSAVLGFSQSAAGGVDDAGDGDDDFLYQVLCEATELANQAVADCRALEIEQEAMEEEEDVEEAAARRIRDCSHAQQLRRTRSPDDAGDEAKKRSRQ